MKAFWRVAMHALVFSLVGENARAYHHELTELPGPYLERWTLVTRDSNVAQVEIIASSSAQSDHRDNMTIWSRL